MSDETRAEPWPDEQNRQLRGRISELEEEVARVRRSLENAETALKAYKDPIAMLRHSMDEAPIGFALYTDEMRYRVVNKSLAQMHGIPAEDHIGRTVEEVVPHRAPSLREAFRQVTETRRPLLNWETSWETTGEPRGMRYYSERWYPLFTTEGRIYSVYCTVTDITAQKRTEEELLVSRERLLLAQSSAGIATYDWNLRENVGHGSREFNPLYGLPAGDIGPSLEEWLQLIHPEDRERVQAEREQTRLGGDPCDSEFRVVWPDGTVHWLLARGKLLRDSEGKPIRMVGVNMDITERKRAEAALATSRDEIRSLAANLLTAQEDAHRKLSSEVHNQICQDLASIAIELGGCAATPPPPGDMASRLKALQARVIQAASDARHIALQLHSPVLDDLGLVIALRELCNQGSDLAPGIAFEFESGVLPEVVPPGVASCVYHIAQESLQNIAKHSKARHAWVSLACSKRTIALTISDDGIGFDTRMTRGNGGLGLIGMEERVRSVNGKLTITAQPVSGTRVALEVPMTE
jgi:PAS domain S-box-containing protein